MTQPQPGRAQAPTQPVSRTGRAGSLAGAGLRSGASRLLGAAARRKAESLLADRFGELRGLPQKIGQVLSMGSDAERAGRFESTREAGAQVPLEDLRPVIEAAWGRPIEEVCRSIEEEGRAASIGQVHRATLRDGRTVAVKVRYPGIEAALHADMDLLGMALGPLDKGLPDLDARGVKEAIRAGLLEELDYRAEAARQREYREGCAGSPVVVPEVIDELSSEAVLTTAWEDGDSLAAAAQWSTEERGSAARRLVAHWVEAAMDRGFVHADLHPGNVRLRRGKSGVEIVLYDFGSVHRATEPARLALLQLVHDTFHREDVDPLPALVTLGFDPELIAPLRHKLPALCRILFAPFGADVAFEPEQWRRSERVNGILGDDRWNFRLSAPAELMLLVRSFQGLLHHLRVLDRPVLWTKPLKSVVERHRSGLENLVHAVRPDPQTTFASLATHLSVLVTEGDRTVVKVRLPATAIDSLEDWLEGDVADRISSRGLDLGSLVQAARAGGYAPGTVFSEKVGQRRYQVALTRAD